MKRDLDRVRALLIECEESSEQVFSLGEYSNFDLYQIHKMAEAGLVEIHDPSKESYTFRPGAVEYGSASYRRPATFKLTWNAHDFLDAVRDDTVWKNTKDKLTKAGGSATLDVVKAVAVSIITGALGLGG